MGLEGWFPLLGPYAFKDEVGMELACVTLRLSLRKGVYVVHLQWDIMRKSLTEWANIYGYVVLGTGDTIFTRVGRNFTETACITRGVWFGKFMR